MATIYNFESMNSVASTMYFCSIFSIGTIIHGININRTRPGFKDHPWLLPCMCYMGMAFKVFGNK